MKFLTYSSVILVLASAPQPLSAEQPGDYYVLPDSIRDGAEIIGFDELELSALKAVGEPAKEAFEAAKARAKAAEEAVRRQVKSDPLATEKVMALFDELLEAESAVKRIELKTIIDLNNLLTTVQRERLMELQATRAIYEGPIKEKVAALKALADSGTVPQSVIDREKPIADAIKADAEAGKFEAADAALTELLARVRAAVVE